MNTKVLSLIQELYTGSSTRTYHDWEGVVLEITPKPDFTVWLDEENRVVSETVVDDKGNITPNPAAVTPIHKSFVKFRLDGEEITRTGIVATSSIKNARVEYYKTPATFTFREFEFKKDSEKSNKKAGDKGLELFSVLVADEDTSSIMAAALAGFKSFVPRSKQVG